MCKHRLIFFNCGHYFHELVEQCRLHHDALREAGWPGWVGNINMPIVDDMETDDVAVGYRRHPCGHCQMQFRPGKWSWCMKLPFLRGHSVGMPWSFARWKRELLIVDLE